MQKILFFIIFVFYYQVNSQTIKAITGVIGQNSFRDAPARFANFILIAIQDAEKYPLQNIIDVHSCKTSYWIYASMSSKTFSIVPGSLQVNIVDDGILVSANIDVNIAIPVKIQWRKKIIACFSHTLCDEISTLTGSFKLSVKFTATWGKNGLTITGTPNVNGDNFNINGCKPPNWMNIFANVQKIIHDKIQEQINTVIGNSIKEFNFPSIYSPYPGIYFNYQVSDVQFSANDRVIITASCIVEADQIDNGVITRLTYIDPDQNDANLEPPINWDLQQKGSLIQLEGIRMSSTLLEAFIWSAQTIGAFNTTFITPFLDTEITFKSELTPPFIGINSDNLLTTSIDSGRTYIECLSSNSSCVNMIDVSYQNLEGNASVITTQNKIGVILQIVSFNISGNNVILNWPPLPVPSEFIKSIENMAFDHLIPSINSFLKKNYLSLPDNVVSLIPNPVLNLINQPLCCNGLHGYLDFATYCSTTENDERWVRCGFAQEQSSQHEQKIQSVKKKLDIEKVYITQYGTQDCILNSENNYASLSYVEVNTSLCVEDGNDDMFIVEEVNGQYNLGMYCNNSCDFSSCQIVQNNFTFGICYQSIMVNVKDSIIIMSELGFAVVASFNQVNFSNCKISNMTTIFTLLSETNTCYDLDNNITAQVNTINYLSYKQFCNSSCSGCLTNINNVQSLLCYDVNDYKFKWYNKDNLPNVLNDGFIIQFIDIFQPTQHNDKNKIEIIILSTLFPIFVLIILILVYNIRNKLKIMLFKYCYQISFLVIAIEIKDNMLIIIKKIWIIVKKFSKFMLINIKKLSIHIKKSLKLFHKTFHKKYQIPLNIETYASLFSLIMTAIVLSLWLSNDPFENYIQSILDKLKIPDGLICQSEQGFQMLNKWSSLIRYGSIIITILNGILVVLSIFYKIKPLIVISLFTELIFGFASIHLPPFFFKFQDMIIFGSCNITQNSTIPDFVINFIEPKIQVSFTGLGIASLANWNLFWLQGLLGGCIIGCLFFWINNEYSCIKKGFFVIIGIAIPISISVPLASIVSIIFLYQAFDVDTKWLLVWLIWWTISLLMLMAIIISSYYNVKKNKLSNKNTTISWLFMIIYLLIQMLILTYALFRESQFTETKILFALGSWLFPISQLTPLIILILDYCTDNPENETIDFQNIPITENNLEQKEISYNYHINIRNALYLTGTLAMGISLFLTFHDYIYDPVINDILEILKKGDEDLQWPKNGTVFDTAINTYSKARWNQLYFNTAAWIILLSIIILNFLSFKNKKIVPLTKFLGYLSMVLMFIGLIIMASPNYLDAMNIERYLPNCTPQFNNLISQSIKMSIGLICAIIFSAKVSIIGVTFSPAIARSANILLLGKISNRGTYTLLWMWVSSSLFGSIMTILPLIFISQSIGDNIILIMTLFFWITPFLISLIVCFIKLKFNYSGYLATLMIICWSLSYIGPIITLILYSSYQYNLWSYVIELLWDVNFWSSIIAEFALSLAIPSDFIESCVTLCKYLEDYESDHLIINLDLEIQPKSSNQIKLNGYGTIN